MLIIVQLLKISFFFLLTATDVAHAWIILARILLSSIYLPATHEVIIQLN